MKAVALCVQHDLDRMVNVKSKIAEPKAVARGCGERPSFGVAGTKTVEYCVQHASDGMVNVMSRKCRTEGCGKRP